MAEANPKSPIPPSEEEELSNYQQFLGTFRDQMQARTRQAQRSENKVTIFLYGISGCGKSSTINYLFHKEIVQASKQKSVTRNVSENGCTIFSELFQNFKISFIDTPGFGDTQGDDAKNLAKISHFVESNLSSHKIFPNIVLIVVSAEDDRLEGIHSTFSKMLHVLSKLNVVDIFHPNVVITVTNAMYFTKKEYKEESERIEKICKVLARAHLSIEVPVVFIENVDKRNEMELEEHWKILPDGTRQPLNLFEAMIHLMKQSGDEVGVEAVRLLFSESSSYEIDKLSSSTVLKPPETDTAKWRHCIDEIFFAPLETDNGIYSALSEFVGRDDIRIFPLAYTLQKIKLVECFDLRNQDLRTIHQNFHPYQLTDEETDWLVHLFEVSRIDVSLDFSSLGLGYSRQSKLRENRVIETGPLKGVNSGNYSMKIPESCLVKDIRKIVIDISHDKNATKALLRHLKITFRISYVLFQVDIDDLKRLNDEFIASLEKFLPKSTDSNTFVDQYAHCTTGFYFGGFVEGELWFSRPMSEGDRERVIAEKSAELLTLLESCFKCIPNQTDQMKTPVKKIFKIN